MCRLALFNKTGIDHVEKTVGINNLFNHLENSLGGHGNGYCIIFNDNRIHIKKGLKLSNEDITNDILKNYKGIKWVMYHTRRASMGTINNSNCHPFKINNSILMMNGTEQELKKHIKKNKTDTETILHMCNTFGIDIKEGTKKFNSVFLGYNNNKVFANRNNGSLEYLHHNKSIILASEFLPEQYNNKNIYIAPKYWEEDQKINFKNLEIAYKNYKEWEDYIYIPYKYRMNQIK